MKSIGPAQRYFPAAIVLFLIVLPHLLPNPFYIHIVIMMAIFAILGGAWNLIGGYAGSSPWATRPSSERAPTSPPCW